MTATHSNFSLLSPASSSNLLDLDRNQLIGVLLINFDTKPARDAKEKLLLPRAWATKAPTSLEPNSARLNSEIGQDARRRAQHKTEKEGESQVQYLFFESESESESESEKCWPSQIGREIWIKLSRASLIIDFTKAAWPLVNWSLGSITLSLDEPSRTLSACFRLVLPNDGHNRADCWRVWPLIQRAHTNKQATTAAVAVAGNKALLLLSAAVAARAG